MKRNQVWRGQRWRNKTTGQVVTILRKASGNFHWSLDNEHHVHEGTLLKYYEPLAADARRDG
mgnify:CR=1 FL=1